MKPEDFSDKSHRMVRILQPLGLTLGLACAVLAALWGLVSPALFSRLPANLRPAVVRQSVGAVRIWDDAETIWKWAPEGRQFFGTQAISTGKSARTIVELPGSGFIKLEEESVVVIESGVSGKRVRVVRGRADVRAATPGSLVLEGMPPARAPIVRTEVVTPPVAEQVKAVAEVSRPVRLKSVRQTAKAPRSSAPSRRQASVRPAPRAPTKRKAPAPLAPAPMVPQILPIQVE